MCILSVTGGEAFVLSSPRNRSPFLPIPIIIVRRRRMGSMLGDWPSFDPHNFSQLRPSSDPSNPSRMTPVTYHPTHDRTLPPPDQVISSEAKNILLRHFYQRADEKSRPKRAASENPGPEHGGKHPRASTSDTPL